MATRTLTPIEARVLATLMEKARTVPDSYPLTLNNVVIGCNQKTSRDPVMEITEVQAQQALDALKLIALVFETAGGRSTRYEHNTQRGLAVGEPQAVLLGLLMLRGPQTAGELRINADRWYKFADISAVEAALAPLQDEDGARGICFVARLPRASGSREARWAHLLCGPVQIAGDNADDDGVDSGPAKPGGLAARVAQLEAQLNELQATVAHLCEQLGLPVPKAMELSPPEQK